MKIIIRTLRNQILIGFAIIILLIGLVSLGTYSLYNRLEHIHSVSNQCARMQVTILNIIKTDNDFFDYEVTNEAYFKSRNSEYIKRHDSLENLERKEYRALQLRLKNDHLELAKIHHIDSIFQCYLSLFHQLEDMIYKRGFRDFGMEGIMRQEAHLLESLYPSSIQHRLLSLRRHEKDFFLRHDTTYVNSFNTLASQELNYFKNDLGHYSEILKHLSRYQAEFNARFKLEKQIGLNSNSGIRNELNELTKQLGNQFQLLDQSVAHRLESVAQTAIIVFFMFVSIAIALSLWLSLWLSKKLSHPIVRLSRWVDHAAGSVTDKSSALGDEIDLLRRSFINLVRQTRKQMKEINDNSLLLDNKNRELIKLNHELDNFLYSTAHDLRAPLSSMAGLVNLMKRELKPGELKLYLDMMQTSIKRQEDFISQIVSYAINNKLEVLFQELDLRQMIMEVFQNHEFIEGAQEIQKYISFYQDAPFYSDKNRLMIILNNLISNAIRYSDPSKGDDRFIEIKVEISHEQISIHFYDNGVGIDDQYIDKIFNMFYKANYHSKGSGLGLFILKEAVTKLNGTISVESKIKIGTLFTLRLPNHFPAIKARPFEQINLEWYQPALN